MRATDRSQLAVAIAVVLASLTLQPLTSDLSYLGPSWLLVLALGASALVLRRLRVSELLVVLVELAVLALGLSLLSAGLPGLGDTWLSHFTGLYADGAEHMRTQAAPMSPNDGVKLMLATAVGVVALLTDLLVLALQRSAWSLAPLATLFLIPAIGLSVDTGPFAFLYVGVGWLAILVAEGLNRSARWTRGLVRDSAEGYGTATPVVWRAATYIGIPSVVLALVLAPMLPLISLNGFGFGNGNGNGGPLQLADPTLDLRRNLRQPANQVVITYTTTDPSGEYLRMASLPAFSSSGWQNSQFALTDTDGTLPAIPGRSAEPTQRYRTTISVNNFQAQYLPLPYAPRSFTAAGRWGTDTGSLVVVTKDNASDLRGLTYEVQSADVNPTARQLSDAVAGSPQDAAVTGDMPSDLPDDLIQLTRRITADEETAAGKAAAIQRYLRSDTFTYSTVPQPGSGYRALENFLLRDRKGYCEQFAASMAMMARIVGIPSRVAVGFLPGTKDGDTWKVSIRDMHAWPELYFSGYGWVRYEPTPSVTGSAPAWTLRTSPDAQASDPASTSSNDASNNAPSNGPSISTGPSVDPQANTGTESDSWWQPVGLSAAGLAVLAVLSLPAAIRVRRRTGRLSGTGPATVRVEDAWAELRDTVVDLGSRWPSGSPRAIGSQVDDSFHRSGQRGTAGEQTEIGRLAVLVERSRYARELAEDEVPTDLAALTGRIRHGLLEQRTRRQRLLALVAPRSLLRSLRGRLGRHR